MPLPRKSTIRGRTTKNNKATKKRKTATTSRARKGERLLVTCSPLVNDYVVRDLANALHGAMLSDPLDGSIRQVVAVRIDGQKIYGKFQEMYEAAPYMFAPVEI